ncbi:MAG: hypothetical protein L0211_12830 [Planctomycetaceae bacterium]|nr:hypothetical protein [Planctomycetaceae bacterium]
MTSRSDTLRLYLLVFVFAAGTPLLTGGEVAADDAARPNIIVILADDR